MRRPRAPIATSKGDRAGEAETPAQGKSGREKPPSAAGTRGKSPAAQDRLGMQTRTPREILVGIDVGTTALKAAAFDARDGRTLARASEALHVISGADGRREQSPLSVDRALGRCISALQTRLGAAWRRVSGLGLAAQGGSGVIVDRGTCRAFTPLVLWNDGRTFRRQARIAAMKPRGYWRALTLHDRPGAGLGRLLWIQEREPELFRESNIYVGAGEYVFFRLTGVWRQDAGNALQIGCYDAVRRRLVQGPLDLVGVPLSFVAPLREGHETHPLSPKAAKRLALPAGLPVAGPYLDQEAGYLAAVGTSDRPLQCSLGTAWVGNFVVPENHRGHAPFQLVLPSPVSEGRLIVMPLLTGNVAWDWALATFIDARGEESLKAAETVFRESLLPPPGLVAVPWLTRGNLFDSSKVGAGCFVGLNAHVSAEDLLRAVAAGMCFEFARVFADVMRSGLIDGVVLAGGASKGPYFRRMLAALFAPLPVFHVEEEDTAAARGALHAFLAQAAPARVVRGRPPSKRTREAIEERSDHYRRAFDSLYGGITEGRPYSTTGAKEKRR